MPGKKLCLVLALTCGSSAAGVSRHTRRATPQAMGVAFGTVGLITIAPQSVTFQARNPEAGTVASSSPASLSWVVSSGSHALNWTVSIQATDSSFSNCPTLPVSAVRVNCSSASVSGGSGTGSCSGSFPLSATLQQLAGGVQGDAVNTYTVTISFTLAESWRYIAKSSCTLNLTYSINAQ